MENDLPNQDGIVRCWFDGELVVEYTEVILLSTDFPEIEDQSIPDGTLFRARTATPCPETVD
ncbi:MAG: hypothetical protein ABFS38_14370 [Bacteroidota bacterium]